MAKKIRKKNPHHRYIDTSFGGIDNKYYHVPVGEGIEMLKEDLKDLAIDSKESLEDLVAAYVESTENGGRRIGEITPFTLILGYWNLTSIKTCQGLI